MTHDEYCSTAPDTIVGSRVPVTVRYGLHALGFRRACKIQCADQNAICASSFYRSVDQAVVSKMPKIAVKTSSAAAYEMCPQRSDRPDLSCRIFRKKLNFHS